MRRTVVTIGSTAGIKKNVPTSLFAKRFCEGLSTPILSKIKYLRRLVSNMESISKARTVQERMIKIKLRYSPLKEMTVKPVSEFSTPQAFTVTLMVTLSGRAFPS